jgi:uncharacterized protein YjbJ (UPF0337 family)
MGAKTDQVMGRVKEAIGDLTNNDKLRRRGKTDKVAGKAKEVVQDSTAKVEDAVDAVKDKLQRH